MVPVCHSHWEAGPGMPPPQVSLCPQGGHSGPALLHGVPRGTAPVRPCPGDCSEADGRSEVRKRFAYTSGSKNLDLHPKRCCNPGGCYQVSPASSELGFILLIFVLEDLLSCKPKRHFYYYFQLLHDSYYSSALTSAINNNRIVNYCSF